MFAGSPGKEIITRERHKHTYLKREHTDQEGKLTRALSQ
jgi:hypothetical protein